MTSNNPSIEKRRAAMKKLYDGHPPYDPAELIKKSSTHPLSANFFTGIGSAAREVINKLFIA